MLSLQKRYLQLEEHSSSKAILIYKMITENIEKNEKLMKADFVKYDDSISTLREHCEFCATILEKTPNNKVVAPSNNLHTEKYDRPELHLWLPPKYSSHGLL
jgi:hypothetical protein